MMDDYIVLEFFIDSIVAKSIVDAVDAAFSEGQADNHSVRFALGLIENFGMESRPHLEE
jgi:hypothetical protein